MSVESRELGLIRVLVQSLRLLGDAGSSDQASGLAAQAWQLCYRSGHPAAAQFNGVLHYLARSPGRSALDRASPIDLEGTPMAESVLDVRQQVPARRHELIFETYHALAPGDAFVLVNDHDPKPLYYQFQAEYPDAFGWDYLESGPEVWRVRIGRT
ncbi:MAG TPA: DUF2249 domain-containing protein [Mycobacteriales bacterium]|nr:DUF2249 domain-containing protein [Mycobacteriales bacterium]